MRSSELLSTSLAGTWQFQTDPNDIGVSESWFTKSGFSDTVSLPGSMAENAKGNAVTLDTPFTGRILDRNFFTEPRYEKYRQPGNIKFPCWLTPLYFYKGVAWYQREINIPKEWADSNVHLHLERPHWVTRVWVDGADFGSQDSLGTPHDYNLGTLKPGLHTLTIRIDNRVVIDVGEDAHSLSDQSQGSWNGIVGDILLIPVRSVSIQNLQVYPAADCTSVEVKVHSGNTTAYPISGNLSLTIRDKSTGSDIAISNLTISMRSGLDMTSVTIPINAPVRPWTEFDPALYEVEALLSDQNQQSHKQTSQFGFRQFTAEGRRFYLNDQHIFLRGTLECAVFPLTGYPPTDKPAWDRIMAILKEYGLNHMRFHSWCPPEAAFQAADEAGIIFSVECSSWAVVGENEEYDNWLYREADAMLRAYGNHPSFCMMLYGNEPYGDLAAPFLGKWVSYFKALDSRRLFSSGTAWPIIPESQFNVWMNPRIQLWDQNLESRINSLPPETTTDYSDIINTYPQPVISHEIGQWCAYPNFDEIPKYTGVLRACNFEIFRDFLKENGMEHQAGDFLLASGKLQVLCYKEEIESALRTPDMGGFQLLDLHDFPGQGSALVGVLDAFWDNKGYVTPTEFRRFCSAIVPLAKLPKRVYTNAETVTADILISHFDNDSLPSGSVEWSLCDSNGNALYSGHLPHGVLPAGELHSIGSIQQTLDNETTAIRCNLQVSIPATHIQNDWDIWIYPDKLQVTPPADVLISGVLDEKALAHLGAGHKVLLMPDNNTVNGDERGQVPAGFSSIFWNTAWTTGQQPHTLGILCDPAHPALAGFPTECHSNWQWWYIIQKSRSMILDPLPLEIHPIVQVIDDWFTARRLGLIFECQLGGGKLLVSSVDCKQLADDDIVCRQLLFSLCNYMGTDGFNPKAQLTRDQLSQVLHL